MYGLIHRAAREMMLDHVGADRWRRCVDNSGLGPDGFISGRVYSDELTLALISAAATELELSTDEMLNSFGQYWILFTAKTQFAEVMELSGDDLITFLSNLDTMHEQMAYALPGAQLPSFRMTASGQGRVLVSYRSHRTGLEPFVVGLLQGLLTRFKLEGEVSQIGTVQAGGADFSIVWAQP